MIKLKQINAVLVVIIIAVNCYTLVLPFYPEAIFWWQKKVENKPEQVHKALKALDKASNSPSAADIPDTENLIIPKIGMQNPVFEGKTIYTANEGLWRRPQTSTPDQGGNTVIVGHRFTYNNPRGTFYDLDKIAIDDDIGLIWHKRAYFYKVIEIKTVSPNDMSVEAPTSISRLTLYTCTPLLTAKNRLVVIAEEIKHE